MSEKIKSKIAALLAKAESTDNAFEAETFMAKVNELLEKHQLEVHEIRGANVKSTDPMGWTNGETNIYASMLWARGVASALARYYGCRLLYGKRGNHIIYRIAGPESARITFELLLPFVISQVRVQAKAVARMYGKSSAERQVGQALEVRIWRMVPKAEERRSELSKNALIVLDDVDAFVEGQVKVKTAKNRTVNFGLAAEEAAEKISINVQATGKHTKLLEG